jgi:surfeit locus 1 family protein
MSEPQAETPTPDKKVFRPKPLLTVFAVLVFAGLFSLGKWQWDRMGESQRKIARYQVQHNERPVLTSLPPLMQGDEADWRLTDLHFRRAEFQGTTDVANLALLTARYKLGQRGYGIVAPFEIAGKGAGNTVQPKVLVHFGWVAEAQLEDFLKGWLANPPTKIRGRLRGAYGIGDTDVPLLQTKSAVAGRDLATWMVPNPRAFAKAIPTLDPMLLMEAGDEASGKPVDLKQRPLDGYEYPVHPLPAKHLEYALTWWGLAASLIGVWIALSRQKREQSEDTEALGPEL